MSDYDKMTQGYREPYSRGGLMRWDLPGGQYVLGDSSIGGGGCCIRDAATDRVLVQGTAAVAALIGEDHPAIAECRALTELAREEQRRFGRELAARYRKVYL